MGSKFAGKLWVVGLAVAMCATAVAGDKLVTGKPFPNFQDTDLLTGKRFSLNDLRGKVVLVDFWATWCGPCIRELPHVKQAYAKYHGQGLEIVSISLDKSIAKCKAFAKNQGMNWRHIADGGFWNARLAKRFGIHSIPAAYVVGRDGVIVGGPRLGGKQLHKAIEKALAQPYHGSQDSGKGGDASGGDDKQADSWLRIARSMAANHNYPVARKYYQRIVDTYPDSPQAKNARKGLKSLPKKKKP